VAPSPWQNQVTPVPCPWQTTRAVCRAANVSHRYFYELFPDTDALLLATYEEAVGRLLTRVGSALTDRPGADVREQLHVSFDTATEFLQEHPVHGRLIFQEALANDALRRHAAPALPAFLRAVRELTADAPTSAPRPLETALISGGLAAVFIEWLSSTEQFTRAELVDYCTDAVLAVMSLGSPAAQ